MAEPVVPRTFVEAGEKPLGWKQDEVLGPVFGVVGEKDKTLEEAAKKDIEVQKQGVTLKDIMSGRVTELGPLKFTPEKLELVKQNPKLFSALALQVNKLGKKTPEEEVIKPLVREGEFVPTVELTQNPQDLEKNEKLALAREQVDSLLVDAGVQDYRVRQIFVNEFQTGNFYESLATRLAEAGQFSQTAISGLPIVAYHGTMALLDANRKGTSWFDEWGSRQNDVKAAFSRSKKIVDQIIPNPSMSIYFNRSVENELKKQLDNNLISQEEYDDILFEKDASGNFLLNEQSEKIRKNIINEETAASLNSLAFDELPLAEQFAVLFTETAAGMAGPGQIKGVNALRKFNRLKVKYEGTEIGDAIKGIKDPLEALNVLESLGVKTKINANNLSIGVLQQRTSESLNRLEKQIELAEANREAVLLQGYPKKSTKYKVANGEYLNSVNRMLRAKYTAKVYPYIKETTQDASIIAAGQLAARYFLPELTGGDMSPETAEVIGAIATITIGEPVVKTVGKGVLTAASSPRVNADRVFVGAIDFIGNLATLGSLRLGGLRLNDSTIETYELAIGRKLSGDERKGIQSSIQMINNLNQKERESVLAAVDEYTDLQNRIVNYFPEKEKDSVRELFNTTFASATGLTMLSGINAVSTNRLDIRNFKGWNLQSIADQTAAATKQVEISEAAILNLERKLQSSNIQDPEVVFDFIQANKAALKSFKDEQILKNEKQLATLSDIRRAISDPNVSVPENFLSRMYDADSELLTSLGQIVDSKERLNLITEEIYTSLNTRIDNLKSKRGSGAAYYNNLGRTTEEMIDTQIDSIWTAGRIAYDAVRKASADADKIDLTEAVEYMMRQAGETQYDKLFSPEGAFFSGRIGRQNMSVFDDMVKRSLPNIKELRDVLIAKGVPSELITGKTNIELAMELKRINPNFKPFSKLDAYEVDVLRRTFRDYANKISDDGALKQVYKNYESTLDNIIKSQNPEIFGLLTQARTKYRSEVGDRLRKGGFLYTIDMSREGGEILTTTSDSMFKYAYKNTNPNNLFRGVSNNIEGALKNNFDAEQNLTAEIQTIVTQFGDTVKGGRVFDLSTQKGLKKFQALQNALGEKVFADWAIKQINQFEGGSLIGFKKQGGYKLDNLAYMDQVHDLLKVPVITKKGERTTQPIVNLSDLYADHRSLNKFVAKNKKAQDDYKNLISDFNTIDSKLRNNITNNIARESDSLDDLNQFTGGLNADSFYQRFILDSGPGEVKFLRNAFVDAKKKQGVSVEEAGKLFDGAVGSLIAKGFMNRATRQSVPEAVLSSVNRDVPIAVQLATPEQLLLDIRDHREKLVNVLGEEHVDYLNDISKYLVRSKEQSIRLDGERTGYTLQGIFSRFYGMARGVVSPAYVTTEFAANLALRSNIDLMQLAAGDKSSAKIISKMFETPELVTETEMKLFDAKITEFVFTEMARKDMFAPELNEMFLLPEEEETNEEEQ